MFQSLLYLYTLTYASIASVLLLSPSKIDFVDALGSHANEPAVALLIALAGAAFGFLALFLFTASHVQSAPSQTQIVKCVFVGQLLLVATGAHVVRSHPQLVSADSVPLALWSIFLLLALLAHLVSRLSAHEKFA